MITLFPSMMMLNLYSDCIAMADSGKYTLIVFQLRLSYTSSGTMVTLRQPFGLLEKRTPFSALPSMVMTHTSKKEGDSPYCEVAKSLSSRNTLEISS